MKFAQEGCMLIAVCFTSVLLVLQSVSVAEDTKKPQPQIVGRILKVDYTLQKKMPPNLLVTAVGQVPTGGYTRVQLVRVIYVAPPEDGIQDYILFAVPPSGPAAQVISEVEATNRWEAYEREARWIKGFRVHGVGDGVTLRMFPGY
jgi:hypothetical protein